MRRDIKNANTIFTFCEFDMWLTVVKEG